MKASMHKILSFATASVVAASVLFLSDSPKGPSMASLLSQAHAVIGRPLTPLSYAGVARRTTRRAVAAGAYAAAAAPVVVVPECVRRYDAYGRPYTVCP